MPNTLLEASLTTAKASGKMSSSVSPLFILFLNSSVFAFKSSSDNLEILSSKLFILSTIGFTLLTSLSLYVPNNLLIYPIIKTLLKLLNRVCFSIK
jgi:hypothetical protein